MPRSRDVAKEDYDAQLAELRVALVNAQYDLRDSGRAVLVTIVGDDRLGAAKLYNVLHEWMDARYLASRAYSPPDTHEAAHPPFWRYWRDLPPHGLVGIWLGGWLQAQLRRHLLGDPAEDAFQDALDRYRRFESLLCAEGIRCVKLWAHLPEREHRARAKKARKGKGDRRLDEEDWLCGDDYEAVMSAAEEIRARTAGTDAPWVRLDASRPRAAQLDGARAVLEGLEKAIAGETATPVAAPPFAPTPPPNVLDAIDLSATVPYEKYKKRLRALQRHLFDRVKDVEDAGLRVVVVLQGWDAAGKGGAVRRMTSALDARDYRVVPIAAPSEEERRYPYLWRFWRQVPPAGKMVIFDRSWYGRVLVERVEGFADDAAWQRAYDEINDFEEQLVRAGSVVLKFWLHIDAEEQLRRFRARESTPYKKYKITRDDYHNRQQWPRYEAAVHDMVARTDTKRAPWHLVAADDKRWARLQVLETVSRTLSRAVKKAKRR